MSTTDVATAVQAPFGSVTAPMMVISKTRGGEFTPWRVEPVAPLALHPASHALHYGSACFEGLKAHRGDDGQVRLFRAADHAARLRGSAAALCLPVPDQRHVVEMLHAVTAANAAHVPPPPGALYLRPTLLGVDANIGAAATPSAEALLYVLASPVGDYFAEPRALAVRIETELPRSTPQFGRVKAGANYAMALGITQRARREDGADQVLFAPGGDVGETGASNFMLLDGKRVITKGLDHSFLHGVTRDSVLALARHLGYRVEERDITVDELLAWAPRGEAALIGTAAVISGVGTLIHHRRRTRVSTGEAGPNTARLRAALVAVQRGTAPDRWGWTEPLRPSAVPAAQA